MAERILHHRSKGPASTPGQRIVELEREIHRLQQALDEGEITIAKLNKSLDRYRKIGGVSFGGIPAAQVWTDFVLWEAILNENPKLETIIELGTWKGGFSWWLWAQAQARRMGFHTFDSIDPKRIVPNFQKRDVFADAQPLADWFRALEPLVLFCDNGNKPRELRTFAELLQHPDTLFVVHDWGTEIHPTDVPGTVEMVYGDFCDELGSISRVFKLRANG